MSSKRAASLKSKVRASAEQGLDRAWKPLGVRRFRTDFERARGAGPVLINLGAGSRPLDGWLNCDVQWHGRHAYLDATLPWPVPQGSVAAVYGDNVIEHLTLADGRKAFRHAFTALRPGGVIRLATPDVEAVARQYLENGELARLGMERNRERGRDMRHPVELLRQVYVGAKHYLGFCYDFESLSAEMRDAGFEVTRRRGGESEVSALRGLESRRHPAEAATELVVEGRKPG